jgi:hypothetical protein
VGAKGIEGEEDNIISGAKIFRHKMCSNDFINDIRSRKFNAATTKAVPLGRRVSSVQITS